MQNIIRSAFALVVLMALTGGAYADPADDAMSEDKAVEGDESGPASKTGAGPTDADDARSEDKAVEGGESGPASKTGAGSTDADDAMSEDKAVEE
jgi:hypothetical protein